MWAWGLPEGRRRALAGADLVTFRDLGLVIGLAGLIPLSWLVPERWWPRLAQALIPLTQPTEAKSRAARRTRMRRILRDGVLPQAPEALAREVSASRLLRNFQVIRCARPGGWTPRLEISGAERIDQGLARGHGVIVWLGFFADSNVVSKVALSVAGYEVVHLSGYDHGTSLSRLGTRLINPITCAIEDRYLLARVTVSPFEKVSALRSLQRHLSENRVVTITALNENVSRPTGARFLDGKLELGSGALDLAYATSAVLLPAFAVRDGPDLHRFTIEPALHLDRNVPRHQARQQAFNSYAKLLETYVCQYPGQWFGWEQLPSEPVQDR